MSVEILLDRLEKVRPNGDHKWMACCPAHADSDPSLAIKEDPDGRILIHCFAGCGGADVMAAIGLSLAELYPEKMRARKGLTPWYRNEQKEKQIKTESAELMLRLCEKKRSKGERLCASDLAAEREAFLLVRGNQ